MGYFETAALQRLNQEAVTFATKFNKQNSIVYAISNNTPEIFIEAIRDGALYWNQAFGYEAIKVIKAPKNITAPSFKYNLIQWVANDYAGSAYADAQVDPRTGETLHAQIFLTSAFAITGKKAARKAILKWDYWQKNNHQKEKEKEVKNLTLKGFDRFELCNFSLNENFIDHLRELVFNQADDAKILKAVSDFIRQVTAHEVGHTLGLRHNFAGSLAANYNALERFDLTKSYNETGSIPKNIIPASSVMDYFIFDEASWIGDIIAKKSGSLSYDALAIQVLYFGKSLDEGNKPLFCTDSHVDKIADCNRFDVGNSYFEIIKMNEDFFARRVAYKILDKFINAKAPPEGELKKSLAKVLMPDPQEFMKMLYPKSFGVMNSLRPAFRLLSIERAQPVIDMTNKVYVQEQAWNYLQNEIVAYGGLDYFLKDEGIASIDKAKEIFKNILEEQKKGLGPAGQEYEFSDQEKQLILDRTDKFFKVLLKDGPLFYANLLNGQLITSETVKENLGILPKHGFSDEVATSLLAQAKKIIFEQTIDKMEVEIDVPLTPVPPVPVVPGVPGAPPTPAVVPLLTKKITVTLPIYKYNYEMRLIAANFLSAKRSESMIWGFLERKGLLAEFKKTNKEILTVDLALIKADEATSVKAAKWIKENQSILQAIIKSSER